jgi:putative transposase
MRHSRLTFIGAYHHVMNRGDKGENIFLSESSKIRFLELLREKSRIYRITVYAYCILDNHFHLVVQNTSGKISGFMRALDGQYALNYRWANKGKGYVFQGRYRSMLIAEGTYLRRVIVYVLLNSVRAGLVHSPYDYRWSSIGEYYTGGESEIVENRFVEELFGEKEELDDMLREGLAREDVAVKDTRIGKILGDKAFIQESMQRFERRKKGGVSKRMRYKEDNFELPDNLIRKFEIDKGIRVNEIDCNTKGGRMLRYELLRLLKEQGGLGYKEIVRYVPFSTLKFSSLGQMYKRAKQRETGSYE